MTLSEYLEKNELSVADFAALVGVERQSVYRWKNGQRFPNRDDLKNIAKATKNAVTANDFVRAA